MKYAQWGNPEAVDLVTKSSFTEDKGERRAILKKPHAMMAAEVPIIPFYFTPTIEAARPNIAGYRAWAAARPIPWVL